MYSLWFTWLHLIYLNLSNYRDYLDPYKCSYWLNQWRWSFCRTKSKWFYNSLSHLHILGLGGMTAYIVTTEQIVNCNSFFFFLILCISQCANKWPWLTHLEWARCYMKLREALTVRSGKQSEVNFHLWFILTTFKPKCEYRITRCTIFLSIK